jgi:Transmembrane domain of unknown function (DUF3566)
VPQGPPDTVITRPAPAPAAHRSAGNNSKDDERAAAQRSGRVRARKVHRIVRHVEPWSVLKLSVLFYAAVFLIVCVASALLWGAARGSGAVDNVESFITSVGGFGNCEPTDGEGAATTTSVAGDPTTVAADQVVDPTASTTVPDLGATGVTAPGDEEECRPGERLVGEFKFEDGRIFQAFALGGIVLVLAGSAANVVLVLLFNLMSDLTGGVRVTVLEEDPPARTRPAAGSPPPQRRG